MVVPRCPFRLRSEPLLANYGGQKGCRKCSSNKEEFPPQKGISPLSGDTDFGSITTTLCQLQVSKGAVYLRIGKG